MGPLFETIYAKLHNWNSSRTTSRTKGARADSRFDLILVLAAAATLVLWASAFPGIRAGLTEYSPVHLVVLRFVTASATLMLIAPYARVRLPQRRHLTRIALLGFVGITAYNLALSYGETAVPAGAASLLVNTGPIFMALLATFLLNDRLELFGWLGLLIGFSGAGIIAFTSGSHLSLNPWALLILLAALLQAISFILQKSLLQHYRPFELTCYAIWCGTALSVCCLPFSGAFLPSTSLHAILAVVYLGVFPAALAYLTWAIVLSRMAAPLAGSLLYAVPIISFVIAWAWLGEVPSPVTLLGGALALSGVVLVNMRGANIRSHHR